MNNQELLAIARKMLQAELAKALNRLKPEHQDELFIPIAGKPLLEWLCQLDQAEAQAKRLKHLDEAQLMLAEMLLLVSKPGLYAQADLEDLQKRAGKLLKEMQS